MERSPSDREPAAVRTSAATAGAAAGSAGATLGARLRGYRVAAWLSQEALAERSGLSVRGLSDLERGISRTPRRETLAVLVDALGLSVEERRQLEGMAHRRTGPRSEGQQGGPPAVLHLLTPLLGRETAMAALLALLAPVSPAGPSTSAPVRLVTLTGPGGVGKTRLALEAATALAAAGRRVVVVPLAPVTDHTLVLVTLAQALEVAESGAQPLGTRLAAALAHRRTLLVLDNLEHLLAAATAIGDLLLACTDLCILATSRAPLRLRGEHLFPVPPLALPPSDASAPRTLAASPAVALFVRRAQAVAPSFALTAANGAAVAAICLRLDGLPLAIELAAAMMSFVTPEVLLTRLAHRLALLTGGPRDLPDRQQTLRATIAWSYDLLAPAEQALARRLAVFVGGGALDAIEAVCQEEGAADGVLGQLGGLVELLRVDFLD